MVFNLELPNIREGKYQKVIKENTSQCLNCERKCQINEGKLGFCGTRINLSGTIYSIVYGYIPAISVNPIEKKPFYHFFPGTYALTVGTFGCNFTCFWCQNHHLSHPEEKVQNIVRNKDYFISPRDLVNTAVNKGSEGTSISFNEPTLLFEYSLDVFKLAKENNLYNTYVSNGYMTEDVLRDLVKIGLDAINIDIKGTNRDVKEYCGIDNEIVWRNAKLANDLGVHVEITTLLIEDLNANLETIESISQRIKSDLGSNIPYHISRFFPRYKSTNKGFKTETSLELLYDSYEIALEFLNYVYIGNIFDQRYSTTYCPNCSKEVITRYGLGLKKKNLNSQGKCSFCGEKIHIVQSF
jgi:pyruvate formate lyase activating enzyme